MNTFRTSALRAGFLLFLLLLPLCLHAQSRVSRTVHLNRAGTLPNYIYDSAERGQITDLTVTGPLNGTDIKLIRNMAGVDSVGKIIFGGRLTVLDLSEASIVEGGDSYYYKPSEFLGSRTTDNAIGEHMFESSNLTSVILPNSITQIGPFAFASANITSINIPEGADPVRESAFRYCSRLTSISLPSTLIYLGVTAFAACTNLRHVRYNSRSNNVSFAPERDIKAVFDNRLDDRRNDEIDVKDFDELVLYVPEGCMDVYRNHPQWKVFENIREMDADLNAILWAARSYDPGKGSVRINRETADSVRIIENKPVTIEIAPNRKYRIEKVLLTDFDSIGAVIHDGHSERRVIPRERDITGEIVYDTFGNTVRGSYTIDAVKSDLSLEVTFSEIPVTGIRLSETEIIVDRGSTFRLTATVSPSDAFDRRVTWQSSDTAVAAVDTAGKVTIQGRLGTATITATTVDGGYTATCKVTSAEIPVTGISLSETKMFVDRDSTFRLMATVSPSDAINRRVTWQSSDTAVAVVDAVGIVTITAVAVVNAAGKVTMQGRPGTATITATTVDGGYTAACAVTTRYAAAALSDSVCGRVEVRDNGKNQAELQAFPNYGYHFDRWTTPEGDSLSSANPFVFALTQDTTIQAHFAKNSYRVTFSVEDSNNTVGTLEGKFDYAYQDTVRAKAVAGYGYHHFVKWTNARGDSLSSANPFAFVLTRDTLIRAHFAKNSYHVTSFAKNGRTETADGKSDYAYQDPVRVKAVADYGYYLVKWTTLRGDSLSSANPFAFVLTRDTTIQAHFAKNSYQVSLSAGKNGRIESGEGEYAYNTQAEARAEADENYHFAKWVNAAGDSLSDANPYRFVVKGDTVLTAVFAVDRHLVTIDATKGGQAFGEGFYGYGTLVGMEAVPDSGYVFTGWMAGGSFDIKISERSKFSFTLTEKAFNSYRAAFLAKEPLTGFETLLGVNGEVRAYYADGVLHLVNLEGYFISISTITGEKVLQFMADGDNEQRAAALPAGVYILNAAKWKERYVVRKFVVKE
ncbi:Bacterial Ig-like domain (group 2) [Bacteroidales bacterium Barb4]|nr:Bacterial Ig-like domain (group 2) [Bacteroidales bacterium Barb4]